MVEECLKYTDGHKFYIAGKTYVEWNPFVDPEYPAPVPVYTRTEYAILTCQCGESIRKRVVDAY